MSAPTLVDPRGTFAPGNINYHLAEAVRWVIRREDQQQNHVAIASGMGPEELSELMTGKEVFTVEDVVALTRALDVEGALLLALAFAFRDGQDPETVTGES